MHNLLVKIYWSLGLIVATGSVPNHNEGKSFVNYFLEVSSFNGLLKSPRLVAADSLLDQNKTKLSLKDNPKKADFQSLIIYFTNNLNTLMSLYFKTE